VARATNIDERGQRVTSRRNEAAGVMATQIDGKLPPQNLEAETSLLF
jgi:hypothetical protein